MMEEHFLVGGKYYLLRNLYFESMENEKKFQCVACFQSGCWKIHFETDQRFYWGIIFWALIIWSSIVQIAVLVSRVWSRREILISCAGISHRPIVSVVRVSSLIILASSPWLWSMAWSSLSVIVSGNRDFLLSSLPFSIRFKSSSRIFLRHQLGVCPFVQQKLQNCVAFCLPF